MFAPMMMKGDNNDNNNAHTDNNNHNAILPQSPTNVRVRSHNTRARWTHSPIVTAMLTGNTLQSCEAVEALLSECYESNSNDRICQAAARQFGLCIKMEEQAQQE